MLLSKNLHCFGQFFKGNIIISQFEKELFSQPYLAMMLLVDTAYANLATDHHFKIEQAVLLRYRILWILFTVVEFRGHVCPKSCIYYQLTSITCMLQQEHDTLIQIDDNSTHIYCGVADQELRLRLRNIILQCLNKFQTLSHFIISVNKIIFFIL